MFVRRLKHKNGLTYIQVIDKVRGKYKVCKSFGSCSTSKEIEERVLLAEQWIAEKQALFPDFRSFLNFCEFTVLFACISNR